MLNQLIKNKSKIHKRDIQLVTYPLDDYKMIIHGVFKDHRYVGVFDMAGTYKEPGVVHHIDVKLLIRFNPLVIEEAEAQMIKVPMPECRTTLDNLPKIKGLEVKSGFSKNIRSKLGGKDGCNHLSQLIVVIGQEIISGWLAHKRRNKATLPNDIESLAEEKYIYNSCRMWNQEGPRFRNLVSAIKAKRES